MKKNILFFAFSIIMGSIEAQSNFTVSNNSSNVEISPSGIRYLRPLTTSSEFNTALGRDALNPATSGQFNTAIGIASLQSNSIGNHNTAYGHASLISNSSGGANTAIGTSAMYYNSTGISNVAIGYNALQVGIASNENAAIGREALFNNTANGNVALGFQTLYNNTSGTENVALGHYALLNNQIGNGNTALGFHAAFNGSTSSIANSTNATAIGANSMIGNNSTNATAIGARAYAPNDNTVIIGSINGVNGAASNTNVGIGTTAPSSSLHIAGSFAQSWRATTTSGVVILDEKDHIYNIVNGGSESIQLPAPATCPNREYVIINQNATTRNITGYWNFYASLVTSIPANSSITVISTGGSWNQIR